MAVNLRGRRGAGDENLNPKLRDVNVTVDGQGLSIMIPTIPRPNKEDIKAGFRFKILAIINSHPVNAPYMAQLIMAIFGLRNRSWGRPSGLTRGMSFACRGFETVYNEFFCFRACFNRRNSYVDFL